MRKYLLLLLLLFVPLSAIAAPEGRVRLSIDESKGWWVGQRVIVHLDLLTDGFSFSGQQFELPQIGGAVLLQIDSSTTKLSETIDGESWQGLRYDLSLFGQRPGLVQVPAFTVRFSAGMGYGQPSADFELTTEPLEIELRLPPGADTSQPVVTSPRLSVNEVWAPEQTEFQVGQSLTRTVTIEAQDVSAMVLPEPPEARIEGVELLSQAPQLADHTDRGSLRGRRQSQLSYLFTRAGDYALPGGAFSWWNPEQEKLETFEYEARQVSVKPDPSAPVATTSADTKPSGFRIRALIIASVVLLLLAALGFALWPRKLPPEDTERQRFKHAVNACASHDPKRAWQAVNAWLNITRLEIAPEDREAWQSLQQAVVSDGHDWHGNELKTIIDRMRKAYLAEQGEDNTPLPPLNPV